MRRSSGWSRSLLKTMVKIRYTLKVVIDANSDQEPEIYNKIQQVLTSIDDEIVIETTDEEEFEDDEKENKDGE